MTGGRHSTIGARTLVAAVGADVAGSGFRSLATGIAAAIERGDLPVGARLPSERSLSATAGCSRGTVVAAYEVLRGQGLVLRRTGSGTWVRRSADRLDAPGGTGGASVSSEEHAAAVRARRLTARVLTSRAEDVIDLGLSALHDPWELGASMLRLSPGDLDASAPHHGYAPSGIDPLRAAVAERYSARVPTDATQITITHGAQNSLAVATELLVHPGDVVVVEQPTFPGAIDVFARAGARLVTVPVGDGGTDVAALARVLGRGDVRAVFLVPTCHSPTGVTTTASRRREIAELIDAAGCWLIEDEALVPLHFDGPPPPPIAGQVRSGRTVMIGSLSKEVWAGLGVGWIRTDDVTTEHLARLRAAVDLGGSVPGQVVALRCLDGLEDRTERLRAALSARAEVLSELVDTRLPDWTWTTPTGGLSLWCRLPGGEGGPDGGTDGGTDRSPDGDDLARHAPSWGVAVLPGSSAAVDASCDAHVRLSFAAPTDQLSTGIERLSSAWDAVRRGERSRP